MVALGCFFDDLVRVVCGNTHGDIVWENVKHTTKPLDVYLLHD